MHGWKEIEGDAGENGKKWESEIQVASKKRSTRPIKGMREERSKNKREGNACSTTNLCCSGLLLDLSTEMLVATLLAEHRGGAGQKQARTGRIEGET